MCTYICVYLQSLKAGKDLTTPFGLFLSSKTGSNTRRYFLTDVCLDLFFNRESPTSPGNLFQCFLVFFSSIHTRTRVFISGGERSSL